MCHPEGVVADRTLQSAPHCKERTCCPHTSRGPYATAGERLPKQRPTQSPCCHLVLPSRWFHSCLPEGQFFFLHQCVACGTFGGQSEHQRAGIGTTFLKVRPAPHFACSTWWTPNGSGALLLNRDRKVTFTYPTSMALGRLPPTRSPAAESWRCRVEPVERTA